MFRAVAGPLYMTQGTLSKFLQVRHSVCYIGSVRGHQVLPPLLASANNNNTKILGVTSVHILLSSQGCQNHAQTMATAVAAAVTEVSEATVTEVTERILVTLSHYCLFWPHTTTAEVLPSRDL